MRSATKSRILVELKNRVASAVAAEVSVSNSQARSLADHIVRSAADLKAEQRTREPAIAGPALVKEIPQLANLVVTKFGAELAGDLDMTQVDDDSLRRAISDGTVIGLIGTTDELLGANTGDAQPNRLSLAQSAKRSLTKVAKLADKGYLLNDIRPGVLGDLATGTADVVKVNTRQFPSSLTRRIAQQLNLQINIDPNARRIAFDATECASRIPLNGTAIAVPQQITDAVVSLANIVAATRTREIRNGFELSQVTNSDMRRALVEGVAAGLATRSRTASDGRLYSGSMHAAEVLEQVAQSFGATDLSRIDHGLLNGSAYDQLVTEVQDAMGVELSTGRSPIGQPTLDAIDLASSSANPSALENSLLQIASYMSTYYAHRVAGRIDLAPFDDSLRARAFVDGVAQWLANQAGNEPAVSVLLDAADSLEESRLESVDLRALENIRPYSPSAEVNGLANEIQLSSL